MRRALGQTRPIMKMLVMCLVLAACSLPRGAAIQSEILKEAESDVKTFDVVEVTRASLSDVSKWPKTGNSPNFQWIDASAGSRSSLIRSGDLINLTIWDSQPNSLLTSVNAKVVSLNALEVNENGSVFVPYVDEVFIRGVSAAVARARIQEKLEPIVPSAQVQLTVTQGVRNSADLVSGVNRPGTYPLPNRNYSILSLISAGGGISNTLRNPLVRLIRDNKTFEVRSDTLLASGKKNTTLRGGDKVIVEEDKRNFTALGASGIENLIYFPKEKVTALEAMSLMGGLADARADPKGVLVLREYSPKQVSTIAEHGPSMTQVVFTLNLTTADGLFAARKFEINPGDTVLATESPITKARTILGLVGSTVGVSNQVANLAN